VFYKNIHRNNDLVVKNIGELMHEEATTSLTLSWPISQLCGWHAHDVTNYVTPRVFNTN